MRKLAAGTTNNLVADTPTATVSINFTDDGLASQAFTVEELPDLTGLTTGADGTATLSIPVTLDAFTSKSLHDLDERSTPEPRKSAGRLGQTPARSSDDHHGAPRFHVMIVRVIP
jgi:hypothetical protein